MGFNAVRMSQQNMERSYAVKLFLTLISCFACVALSGVETRARGCTFVPSGGGESIDAWTTNEDAGLAGFTVIAHAQSGVAQSGSGRHKRSRCGDVAPDRRCHAVQVVPLAPAARRRHRVLRASRRAADRRRDRVRSGSVVPGVRLLQAATDA